MAGPQVMAQPKAMVQPSVRAAAPEVVIRVPPRTYVWDAVVRKRRSGKPTYYFTGAEKRFNKLPPLQKKPARIETKKKSM